MKCYNGISMRLRILSVFVKTYHMAIFGAVAGNLTIPSDCAKKYQQRALPNPALGKHLFFLFLRNIKKGFAECRIRGTPQTQVCRVPPDPALGKHFVPIHIPFSYTMCFTKFVQMYIQKTCPNSLKSSYMMLKRKIFHYFMHI